MGFFNKVKNSVMGYSDPYDYRIDAVLKCVKMLLSGDVGDLRKVKSGNDWAFSGGTLRGLMGTQVLNDHYSNEIDSCHYNGMSVNACAEHLCAIINKSDFIRMCDNYANRPIR